MLVAALRISTAYYQEFPSYDGFEHLRQIDHIRETGAAIYDDELSFSGRTRLLSPIYYYIMALFSFLVPKMWLIKVIPNLFAAAIVFPAYHLAKLITHKKRISLITAGLAGFVPALFLVSVNDGSATSLTITLLFTLSVLFLKTKKNSKNIHWFMAIIVFLIMLQPLSIVFLLALFIYIIILKLRRINISNKAIEVTLFSLFFMAWFYLIMFKQAFVSHGVSVIWQNIPAAEVAAVFSQMTLLQAISSTGLVTLILGAIGLYESFMNSARKPLFFLSSIGLSTLLLLWFRFIPLQVGLAVVGVSLAIASGYSLLIINEYLEKTKAPGSAWWAICGIIALFLLMSVPTIISAAQASTPEASDIEVLGWASENLGNESIILASPIEGNMITYVANHKNVIDNNYLLIPRIEERYSDVNRMYSVFFKTDALFLMQKYGVSHIYVSEQTSLFSNEELPRYLEDERCFKLVKSSNDESRLLFERTCSLRGDNDV